MRRTVSMVGSDDEILGSLHEGAVVEVVEVRMLVAEGRVRGRIIAPAGWISLRNLESNEAPWAIAVSEVVVSPELKLPKFDTDSSTSVEKSLKATRANGHRSPNQVRAVKLDPQPSSNPGLSRVAGLDRVSSHPLLPRRNSSVVSEVWQDDVSEEQFKALERLKLAVKTARSKR